MSDSSCERYKCSAPTLSNTTQEVFVGQLGGPLPESNHASLDTCCLELCAVELVRAAGKLFEVDIRADSHFAGVDLENTSSGSLVWKGKFDFAIQSPRTKKSRIENINAVCSSNDL